MNRIIPLSVIIALALGLLQSQALAKPTLTIYTYDAFAADWGPAPGVKKAFEAECDCQVDFVAMDSSIGILRKVQLEGSGTKADIVLGLDTNLTDVAGKTGLFSPHGVTSQNSALPIDWSSDLFLPFDFGYFAFVYDTNMLANPPGSFEELAAMKGDFKVVIQDPRSSAPGLGLMLWIKEAYGDRAPEIWQKIAPKILTITKGWSEAYGLFLKGEADMVMSYTTSPAYHLIAEKKDHYKAAAFTEGHYMQVEVGAIVKSTQQQDLARRFMAFMVSDKFQSIIPTTNWMYPASKTALPAGFASLYLPGKSLLMDGMRVEKNRKAWIKEWQAAITK